MLEDVSLRHPLCVSKSMKNMIQSQCKYRKKLQPSQDFVEVKHVGQSMQVRLRTGSVCAPSITSESLALLWQPPRRGTGQQNQQYDMSSSSIQKIEEAACCSSYKLGLEPRLNQRTEDKKARHAHQHTTPAYAYSWTHPRSRQGNLSRPPSFVHWQRTATALPAARPSFAERETRPSTARHSYTIFFNRSSMKGIYVQQMA